MQVKRSYIPIGEFQMTSGNMRVSDPCYNKDVWCAGVIPNCRTGTWEAAIVQLDEGSWGIRNSMLVVRSASSCVTFETADKILPSGITTWDSELEECEFEVGVDSGQAGVFDDLYYGEDSVFDGFPEPPEDFGSVWYSNCCNITLYDLNAGTIPCGALSSSGYGDGGYPAYSHKGGDGKVDLVAIMFIGEENEEEDDWGDDLEYEQ